MDGEDDSLTIQYLRVKVSSLEEEKKELENRLNYFKDVSTKLESIWDIIFPENKTKNKKKNKNKTKNKDKDKDNNNNSNNRDNFNEFDIDKLYNKFNLMNSNILNLENRVFSLKNRESSLLLKLCASEKLIHKHQTQILILRDELKSQNIRNKKLQFIDPLINYNFNFMLNNINNLNKQLKNAKNEAIANSFNMQSNAGRSLIEKCKKLIIENQVLSKQIQINKNSNLNQQIILLHQHNLKLHQLIIKLQSNASNIINNNNNMSGTTK